LFPRVRPNYLTLSKINLGTIANQQDHFFEARILPVSDENGGKFQILFDQVLLFEDRQDLNLALKVTSDFMRADVTFILTQLDSGHNYMAQHIFEDAKKLAVVDL